MALNNPEIPGDLSGFNFGNGLDLALMSITAKKDGLTSSFNTAGGNGSATVIPEPASILLATLGASLALLRRRRGA